MRLILSATPTHSSCSSVALRGYACIALNRNALRCAATVPIILRHKVESCACNFSSTLHNRNEIMPEAVLGGRNTYCRSTSLGELFDRRFTASKTTLVKLSDLKLFSNELIRVFSYNSAAQGNSFGHTLKYQHEL